METIKAQLADPKKAAKILLVPVLAIVLAFVVFRRGDRAASGEAVQLNPAAAQRDGLAADGAPSRRQSALADANTPGPTFDIGKVVQSNPFLLPLGLRPATKAADDSRTTDAEGGQNSSQEKDDAGASAVQAMTTALAQKSVSIIAATAKGPVAFVDSRPVTIGDYLQEGVRVVEIGPDGVVVEVEPQD